MGHADDGGAPPEPGPPDDSGLERLTPTLMREVTRLPDARHLTLYSRADPDNPVEP
jgi:hypothetical protein